jgi:hypothetical protein
MPRVIVTTDDARPERDGSVLLDEQVASVHLSSGHAAAQLVERLAWAISDAEQAETGEGSPSRPAPERRPRAPRPAVRAGRRRTAVGV